MLTVLFNNHLFSFMTTGKLVTCPDPFLCLGFGEINRNRVHRQVSCPINVSYKTIECPWLSNVPFPLTISSHSPVLCSNIRATQADINRLTLFAQVSRDSDLPVAQGCPV